MSQHAIARLTESARLRLGTYGFDLRIANEAFVVAAAPGNRLGEGIIASFTTLEELHGWVTGIAQGALWQRQGKLESPT